MVVRHRFFRADSILSLLPDPLTRFEMTPLASTEAGTPAPGPTPTPAERERGTAAGEEQSRDARRPRAAP